MRLNYLSSLLFGLVQVTRTEIVTEVNTQIVSINENGLGNGGSSMLIETNKTIEDSLVKQFDDVHNVKDEERAVEARKQNKQKEEKGFMERILPMMVIPFMVSTSMIPMMLVSMFVMLLKSALIGKLGLILMLVNMFRQRTNNEGGVFSHNININKQDDAVAMEHYGYRGDEEYGAYVNRRRRRSLVS